VVAVRPITLFGKSYAPGDEVDASHLPPRGMALVRQKRLAVVDGEPVAKAKKKG
jgi:hypothetical protein